MSDAGLFTFPCPGTDAPHHQSTGKRGVRKATSGCLERGGEKEKLRLVRRERVGTASAIRSRAEHTLFPLRAVVLLLQSRGDRAVV
jgi:hypothetical protein